MCSLDWLEIRDGGDKHAPPIHEKLCGFRIPNAITSSGNEIFFRFKSDYKHVGIDCVECQRNTGYRIQIVTGGCNH